MTLPMVPPSFEYGRSDPRTPPESSVVHTTRRLKPPQTATPDQRREVHGHAAFRIVAQRYQPSGSASCQVSYLAARPVSGAPGPMTGPYLSLDVLVPMMRVNSGR